MPVASASLTSAKPSLPPSCQASSPQSVLIVCLPCFHGWPGAWAVPSRTATRACGTSIKPGLIDQRGDAGEFREGAFARGQVVHGEHRVRLAAAESGLKLNDRLAALAGQPLGHLRQQQPHAFGDEGAVKERHRVLILLGWPYPCGPP